MNAFSRLKCEFHTEPKEPLSLPDVIAPCDQCEEATPTKIKFMRAGYGNACARCGRLRRGNPYLSKADFNALKPKVLAQGEIREVVHA